MPRTMTTTRRILTQWSVFCVLRSIRWSTAEVSFDGGLDGLGDHGREAVMRAGIPPEVILARQAPTVADRTELAVESPPSTVRSKP